eukprot:g2996.t1
MSSYSNSDLPQCPDTEAMPEPEWDHRTPSVVQEHVSQVLRDQRTRTASEYALAYGDHQEDQCLRHATTQTREESQPAVLHDFGPPTGRGMRAVRSLARKEVALRIPLHTAVTPRKCRAFLKNVASVGIRAEQGGRAGLSGASCDGPSRFSSFTDLLLLQAAATEASCCFVRIARDWENVVEKACRDSGIDREFDFQRRQCLGKTVRVLELDPSDDTLRVELLPIATKAFPGAPAVAEDAAAIQVWFGFSPDAVLPAAAQCAAASSDEEREAVASAIDSALSDENTLVVAVLVAQKIMQGGCAPLQQESTSSEKAVNSSLVPENLQTLLGEWPAADIGLPAEWSEQELEFLKPSVHYKRAKAQKGQVLSAKNRVEALFGPGKILQLLLERSPVGLKNLSEHENVHACSDEAQLAGGGGGGAGDGSGSEPKEHDAVCSDTAAAIRSTSTTPGSWVIPTAVWVAAWTRVASRHRSRKAFPSFPPEEGKTLMLPGGCDMFNHSVHLRHGASTVEGKSTPELVYGRNDEIHVVCQQDLVLPGEEVFISYGNKPNHELLMGYGFLVDGNENDCFEVVVDLKRYSAAKRGEVAFTPEATEKRLRLTLDLLHAGLRTGAFTLLEAGAGDSAPDEQNSTPSCESVICTLRGGNRSLFPEALHGLCALENMDDEALLQLDDVPRDQEEAGAIDSSVRLSVRGAVLQTYAQLGQHFRATLEKLKRAEEAPEAAAPQHFRQQHGVAGGVGDDGSASPSAVSKTRRYFADVLVRSEKRILEALVARCEDRVNSAFLGICQRMLDSCRRNRHARGESSRAHSVRSEKTLALYRVLQSSLFSTATSEDAESPCGGENKLKDDNPWNRPQVWQLVCEVAFRCVGMMKIPHEVTRKFNPILFLLLLLGREPQYEPPSCPYAALLHEKVVFWGQFLFSQFAANDCLSVADTNMMKMESINLRKQHSWSVPMARDLLQKIARQQSPIVEIGCGRGLWAQLLRAEGAVIQAFDLGEWCEAYGREPTSGSYCLDSAASEFGSAAGTFFPHEFVQRGGPEVLLNVYGKEHCAEMRSKKTLLLSWPDFEGKGTFGLETVRNWSKLHEKDEREAPRRCVHAEDAITDENNQNEKNKKTGEVDHDHNHKYLLCVGEWGRGANKSFSRECMAYVYDRYELVCTWPLPRWPLAEDEARLYRMKPDAKGF